MVSLLPVGVVEPNASNNPYQTAALSFWARCLADQRRTATGSRAAARACKNEETRFDEWPAKLRRRRQRSLDVTGRAFYEISIPVCCSRYSIIADSCTGQVEAETSINYELANRVFVEAVSSNFRIKARGQLMPNGATSGFYHGTIVAVEVQVAMCWLENHLAVVSFGIQQTRCWTANLASVPEV